MKTIDSQGDADKRASKVQEAESEYEQPLFSRRETLLTMMGVLLVMLLSALDQTIVATALPRIITDLNGFDQYTWVSTSYLLTSTVMVPIYGKLSDIFGRKPIFMIGVVLFLAGSAMSGAAQTMTQLILFRGFQGIGAGALMPIAMTVVGDLFTPRERGRWQGITGAVFGLASILGPTLGGWISDNFTWRWIFYVNLPVGIVALLVLIFLMPTLRAKDRKTTIDYIGCALIALGTVPMLLGFTWAGTTYPWLSWQVLGLIIGGAFVLGLFFLYEAWTERRNAQPIIEPGLFKNSVFSVSSIVTVIFGVGLFGSVSFIPLFIQGVVGSSATNSGVLLMPLMLTAMVASIISGQLVARFGRYKWLTILSMAISVVGGYLLFRLDIHSGNTDVVIAMLVLGLGMGVGMSLYTLIVQNALPHKMAQATSALTFFRQIGATIGLAAMGSLMISAFPSAFSSALPASVAKALPPNVLSQFSDPNKLLSPVQAGGPQLPHTPQALAIYQQITQALKQALATSLHNVFILCLIVMVAGLISVFFLKEITLRERKGRAEEAEEEPVMEVSGIF
ncbi:MAG TPA: MDR family MFS transporter [Ktedonobacteraceae bacterium]|nr:MDR family MFS transporter [Ktedonobacteraceae bacterium]